MRDGGLRKIVARVAGAEGAGFVHGRVRNLLGRTGLRRAGRNGVCRTRDGQDGNARDDERMVATDLTDHGNLLSRAALTALGVPQAMTARLINAFGQTLRLRSRPAYRFKNHLRACAPALSVDTVAEAE
jgi:hypothetical protein